MAQAISTTPYSFGFAGFDSKDMILEAAWQGGAVGKFAYVLGVMGAFFLIRRAMIPSPALFDKDFFFFYEDTALAHTLQNNGVPCYIVPGASIIHLGGKSGSANSISSFYQSRYLYLNKFYGPFHARAVHFLDRTRILRKWSLYSLFSRLTASQRIKDKQRHYKMAWEAARQK